MPIFNASVTGEGGGQGGGDKVTALVGSNASGIDVGDKVILNYPATYDINYTSGSSINYPYYFDGYFLYASGGIFATDGAGSLTYLGNSGSLSGSWGSVSYHIYFPPTYTSNGICFGYGQTRNGVSSFGLMFFSSGAYTGAFNGYAGSGNRSLVLDARLDSSNTGFASLMSLVDYNNYEAHLVYVANGSVTVRTDNAYFPFFTENGDCYAANWSTDKFYKATYNGSAITFTELGSSGIVEAMFGAVTNGFVFRAVQSSRKDDYQFWYHAGNSIKGFTHIDTTNNTIAQITTPSALDAVKGTVYAAWWDLDNRLFIRTSTGLFVFAYTNHDISTMQLVKKFEWTTDYSGSASCSPDLMSYAVGNDTYVRVVRETVMPVYEFSANVYNGQNFAGTSLTGFVNEAPTTDPYGQSIVEVNTVKDPADTWTNVGTPFGFDVSTTSSDVSVGWGYYNSGSAEVIIPATVTKTLSQASSGQTTGFKNDVVVYHDTSDNNSALICKTGTTPVGTFKASTSLSTNVYLSGDKTAIAGTTTDSGFAVSYVVASDVNYAYTVEGSATVVDGIASNFGTNDYIKFSSDFGTPTSFEMGIKLKTPADWNNGMDGEYIGVNFTDKSGFYVKFMSSGSSYSSGIVEFNVSTSAGSWGSATRSSYVFLPDTVYYMKINWNGSTWKLYYSLDGESYTQLLSVNYSTWISRPENYFVLGTCGCWGRAHPFLGSIYLNDCYMKVNDSLWWSPAADPYGSVTVASGYSYIDETDAPFYLGSSLTRTASQMVVHSEDFVEQSVEVEDFTVVGNPTIVGKVASNFSSNDYISKAGGLSGKYFILKIDRGTSSGTNQVVCEGNIALACNNGTLRVWNRYYSSWRDILSLNSSTVYWIKVVMNNLNMVVYSSTDGSNYTQQYSEQYSSSSIDLDFERLGAPNSSSNYPFGGSIYLDDCKIYDENASVLWSAYKTETSKQGTLFLTQPTAGTTSSVVSANATPTASYVGSVVDPIDMGKMVTMDTTLTKILAVEDA